ncbi:MAG: ubiquinol-cytochrome c reductase iron-sulfur subunit, partial [Desulfobaccales bacterium]
LRQMGVGILGAASIIALGGIAATTAVSPGLLRASRLWVPVAPLSRIPEGDITTIMMRYDLKNGLYTQEVAAPVLVSRTGSQIICFNASCTHLGCIVRWDSQLQRFRCACHGGVFDQDGRVLAGPPPRPLDRYRFKVDSGHLLVEVG